MNGSSEERARHATGRKREVGKEKKTMNIRAVHPNRFGRQAQAGGRDIENR